MKKLIIVCIIFSNSSLLNAQQIFNEGVLIPRGTNGQNSLGEKLLWGWSNGPFISSIQNGSDADNQGMVFYTHPTGAYMDNPVESMQLKSNGDLKLKYGIITNNLGRRIQWGNTGPYIAPINVGSDPDQQGLVFYTHRTGTFTDPPERALIITPNANLQLRHGLTGNDLGRKLQWGNTGPFIAPINTGSDPDQQGLTFHVHSSGTFADPPIEAMRISSGGNLAVYGKIEAKEIKVTLTPTADFVFEDNYDLYSLSELEKYIETNGHLPGIPSAKKMIEEGQNLAEMNIKLLQKIEELTLYIIQQEKKLKSQNSKIEKIKKEENQLTLINKKLFELQSKLEKLESKN